MKERRIRVATKRKFVPTTTDSNHRLPVAQNLLDRQFHAPLPNPKWSVDITYIPTDEGWMYLAGVIDLCSRRIVGWSMADHMKVDLVSDALKMAIALRCRGEGLCIWQFTRRSVRQPARITCICYNRTTWRQA